MNFKKYETFTKEVARILKINVPKLSKDTSVFATDTQIACADIVKNIIYVNSNADERDILFAISHEARHLWQAKHNLDVSSHKKNGQVSFDDYNTQPEEIDANAFGVLVMNQFGLNPMFDGLGENVKKLIYSRAEEIADKHIF